MQIKKVLAVALILAGVLALAYGGFSYTKETHEASIGPIELAIEEKERVNIPIWVGVVLIGAGIATLVIAKR